MKNIPLLESFSLKWGEVSNPTDWEKNQYTRGWSVIGDIPPTVEQFDGVHNIQDAKSNYLYRQLCSVFEEYGIKPDATDNKTLLSSFRSALDEKVNKGGDTITGKLTVEDNSNDKSIPVELINNQPRGNQRGDISAGPGIRFTRPNIFGLFSEIYVEDQTGLYHSLTIHLKWPESTDNVWNFRHDGHIYGPHGKLINANDGAYEIGSYTIALLRGRQIHQHNAVVAGAQFIDSNIGGDVGNDYKWNAMRVGDKNAGGLSGSWRIMTPVDAVGDNRGDGNWGTINLIKRVA